MILPATGITNSASACVFHNILGVGFDAHLAKKLQNQKGWFKQLAYLLAAIESLPFYQEQELQLLSAQESVSYQNLISIFANGQYFGGGMRVAPNAEPSKACLDIVRAQKAPILSKMAMLAKLALGSHLTSPYVHYKRTSAKHSIATAGLAIEADGEVIGYSPCQISVSEQSVKLKR